MLWQHQCLKTMESNTCSSQPGWVFHVHFPSGAVLWWVWIRLKLWIYKYGIFCHYACFVLNFCSFFLPHLPPLHTPLPLHVCLSHHFGSSALPWQHQKCGLCPKAWGTWAKGQSPERLTPQSSPQPSLSVWTLPEQQMATGRMVALPNKVTVLGAAAAEKSVHPNNAVCLINL